ncbi:39S mitochondrial ribosomal protein L46-domain-containing protein [Tuber borchii]|uniref:Large ribosomal subunit protein mL46 n=1 Tax=Tuber borchii TaxID=42251 RepID=A0A2T6ZHT0_TUBBO|nr:39S mitochondrial ribosomal protein L46-domain-containing protein [Tuber borchii]
MNLLSRYLPERLGGHSVPFFQPRHAFQPPPVDTPPVNPPLVNPPLANPPAVDPTKGSLKPVEAHGEFPRKDWWDIAAGVVISRPPLLTRDLPEFEQSYYFYQRRLNDRLQLPFARWFYFKKGTLAEDEWKRKQAAEERYQPYGPRAWADELLKGSTEHKLDPLKDYERLVATTVTGEEETMSIMQARRESAKEAEARGEEVEYPPEIVEKPFPRTTQADIENNTKRLDRKMSRTLYLVVKKKRDQHAWRFPQSRLSGKWEHLRWGAQRTLLEAAGPNMNTWFVGSAPIGLYKYKYPPGYAQNQVGKKVFFMKARILAGQANLTNNKQDLEDFQWLAKDELKEVVGNKYYKAVQHMLVAQ